MKKAARSTRPTVPPPQRRRSSEDLQHAEFLRPNDVYRLYGLNPMMVFRLCTHGDERGKLPSVLIRSKSGRKGIRLVRRTDLETFLAARQVNAPAA